MKGDIKSRNYKVTLRKGTQRIHDSYEIVGHGLEKMAQTKEELYKYLGQLFIPFVFGCYEDIEISISGTKGEFR